MYARCSRLFLLVVWCVLPALHASELTINLDASKSQVNFVLIDVLHTVHGAFHLKEGHLLLDSEKQILAGEIVVDAASGQSGNTIRDRRMARDVLQAQKYPEIRFTPHKFAGTFSASDSSDLEVTGSFQIHGQSHEITVPMRVHMANAEMTAISKFVIPYVQWGMKNPSNFLLRVNDQVEIDLNAVGRVNGPTPR